MQMFASTTVLRVSMRCGSPCGLWPLSSFFEKHLLCRISDQARRFGVPGTFDELRY